MRMSGAAGVHFISGLPRSGSTLLCALLRQNPRFVAGVTSPVLDLFTMLLHQMGAASEFAPFYTDDRRARILKGLMRAYHAPAPGQMVFDTARLWTRHMALIASLYPSARVICCVRDIPWIMDSTERMLQRNPLQTSAILDHTPGVAIGTRAASLMEQSKGFIGGPWSGLREAWFGPFARKLLVLRYESLAERPGPTLNALYAELGEAPFVHRFDRLDHDEPEYDAKLGMPGLHRVREHVAFERRESILPPEFFNQYVGASFWREPGINPGGVVVL
jgi:sulfotransferase